MSKSFISALLSMSSCVSISTLVASCSYQPMSPSALLRSGWFVDLLERTRKHWHPLMSMAWARPLRNMFATSRPRTGSHCYQGSSAATSCPCFHCLRVLLATPHSYHAIDSRAQLAKGQISCGWSCVAGCGKLTYSALKLCIPFPSLIILLVLIRCH